MRQLLLIAAFAITFLVPGLAHANFDHSDEHGGNRDAQEGRDQEMARSTEQRAFNKSYATLDQADKDKFKEIIMTAVGEDMMRVNQSQLVGFMSFIKANVAASCSVVNASKADMKSLYILPGSHRSCNSQGGGYLGLNQGAEGGGPEGGAGISIRPALMCTAGETKKMFVGLPASTLNKYYNSNIKLASETTTTPTTTKTTPAPTTASTQPATSYGAYISQSLADNQGTAVQNTAFTEQSVQAKPASDEGMHFSSGASH